MVKDTWEYIEDWKEVFGRLPEDADELTACIDFVEDKKGNDQWDTLKKAIKTQVEFCERRVGASGMWGNTARIYRAVLSLMKHIEDGTHYKYVPFDGLWKTEDEVKEMLKEEDE